MKSIAYGLCDMPNIVHRPIHVILQHYIELTEPMVN